MRKGVKGRLKLFRKFISFGDATVPNNTMKITVAGSWSHNYEQKEEPPGQQYPFLDHEGGEIFYFFLMLGSGDLFA